MPAAKLRSVEDAYVDQLFSQVPNHGAPLLRARFARSFVDVNRARSDLSLVQRPDMCGPESPRARAGLGVIPLSIGLDMPIYKTPPSQAEITHRLSHYYDNYHAALEGLVDAALRTHGQALLIDCHSMPGTGAMGAKRADFVLGDCYGMSCDNAILRHAAEILRGMGYRVGINHPYAGGYITQRHGRPHEGRHALQIEISRALYMNPVTLRRAASFDRLAQNMDSFARAMIDRFGKATHLVAAE